MAERLSATESKLWIDGQDGWYVAVWGDTRKLDWYAAHYELKGYKTQVSWERPTTAKG